MKSAPLFSPVRPRKTKKIGWDAVNDFVGGRWVTAFDRDGFSDFPKSEKPKKSSSSETRLLRSRLLRLSAFGTKLLVSEWSGVPHTLPEQKSATQLRGSVAC